MKTEEIEEWFDKEWNGLPPQMKSGKSRCLVHFKETVHNKSDFEDFQLALNKYLQYVQFRRMTDFPKLSYQNGITFFRNWAEWFDYEPPDNFLGNDDPKKLSL